MNRQVIAAVYAHRDASLEQGFPEIISVRIIRPPGMIQRSTEMIFLTFFLTFPFSSFMCCIGLQRQQYYTLNHPFCTHDVFVLSSTACYSPFLFRICCPFFSGVSYPSLVQSKKIYFSSFRLSDILQLGTNPAAQQEQSKRPYRSGPHRSEPSVPARKRSGNGRESI